MKQPLRSFNFSFVCIGLFVVLVAGGSIVEAGTNSVVAMDRDFVKTNGQYVIIGNMMFATNSPLNTEEFKQFKWRGYELMKIASSGASNATDQLVTGAWALAKDYPKRENGYQLIMEATEDYEYQGQPAKARALANELIASSGKRQLKFSSDDD